MASDKTLQVVVTEDEALAIKEIATSMGVSVSAYIRNLVLARTTPLVPAWWVRYIDAESDPARRHRKMVATAETLSNTSPHMLLEPVAGERDDYLLRTAYGHPFSEKRMRTESAHVFTEIEVGRVRLGGDPRLWRVERSITNVRAAGQLRWRLVADRKGDAEDG